MANGKSWLMGQVSFRLYLWLFALKIFISFLPKLQNIRFRKNNLNIGFPITKNTHICSKRKNNWKKNYENWNFYNTT